VSKCPAASPSPGTCLDGWLGGGPVENGRERNGNGHTFQIGVGGTTANETVESAIGAATLVFARIAEGRRQREKAYVRGEPPSPSPPGRGAARCVSPARRRAYHRRGPRIVTDGSPCHSVSAGLAGM